MITLTNDVNAVLAELCALGGGGPGYSPPDLDDGREQFEKLLLLNNGLLPDAHAKQFFLLADEEPWQVKGALSFKEISAAYEGAAALIVYPDALRAETGQSGICISTPWFLRMRAEEARRDGNDDFAAHLEGEAALYPQDGNASPSWVLDWIPDPDAAGNRAKGLEEARDILELVPESQAATAWVDYLEDISRPREDYGLWQNHVEFDFKRAFNLHAQTLSPSVGSLLHDLVEHYRATDPERSAFLRRVAEKYYVDPNLEVSVMNDNGIEHELFEFEWIGPQEEASLRSKYATELVEIPGSISLRPYSRLSYHSMTDTWGSLPFRGFLFVEEFVDSDEDRVSCVVSDGVTAYRCFSSIDWEQPFSGFAVTQREHSSEDAN